MVSEQAADRLIGALIENRFVVDALVGKGGMATVYKAHHRQVELIVAVKVLKKEFAETEENIERFKREARTINSLFHPNIINMYSFGILDSGEPYLVLDFMNGQSLADLLDVEKTLPYARSLPIFIQTCSALTLAHESGVLHRDIKPHNIMLLPGEDGGDLVKVLDFGIAKLVSAGLEAQKLTQTGHVFGSPVYMSPEQCEGKELDIRSDVYSMGCLMYETLAGKPPLVGPHVMATMFKHLYEMPPPFGEANPSARIPTDLEAIVFKTLQKNPDDRYQTMAHLESDLKEAAT